MSLSPTQLFAVLTPTQQLSATLHEAGPAGPEGPPGPAGPPGADGTHGTPTTIADEGVSLAEFDILNFIGSGVSAAVDIPNNRINVTIPGGSQTPWVSNIDGANFNLGNVSTLGIGEPAPTAPFKFFLRNGWASFNAESQPFALYITYAPGSTGYWIGATSDGSLQFSEGGAGARCLLTSAGNLGLPTPHATYKLNVTGDCNLSAGSVYRINGVAQGQTPWTSDIDAANHSLANVSVMVIHSVRTAASGGQLYLQSYPGSTFGPSINFGWIEVDSVQLASMGSSLAVRNSDGTAYASFACSTIRLELPSASPGAGTKQLYYDAADGNRVKYAV